MERASLSEDLVQLVVDLIQLDVDASFAYGQAIEGVDGEGHSFIRESLTRFQADHERHVSELAGALRGRGIEPPERRRDAKGVLLQGMTAVRAAFGTRQALKAMRQNEKLTNGRYAEAVGVAWPSDVADIVRRARDDEVRHLDFIERTLLALEGDVPGVNA